MSSLYLLALVGVCVVLFAVLIEGAVAVSRQPRWMMSRDRLERVDTVEHRIQELPFVGADRRRPADHGAPAVAAKRRA